MRFTILVLAGLICSGCATRREQHIESYHPEVCAGAPPQAALPARPDSLDDVAERALIIVGKVGLLYAAQELAAHGKLDSGGRMEALELGTSVVLLEEIGRTVHKTKRLR